jgi:hypothetical protein
MPAQPPAGPPCLVAAPVRHSRSTPTPTATNRLARGLLPCMHTRLWKRTEPAVSPAPRVGSAPRCSCPDNLAAAQLLLPSLPCHTRPLCLREGHGLLTPGHLHVLHEQLAVPPDLVRCLLLNGLRRPPRAAPLAPGRVCHEPPRCSMASLTLRSRAASAPARPPPGASRVRVRPWCCPRAGPRRAAAPWLLPRTRTCAPSLLAHGEGSPGRRRARRTGVWQNRLNYSGSSALTIIMQLPLSQRTSNGTTHWSVGSPPDTTTVQQDRSRLTSHEGEFTNIE